MGLRTCLNFILRFEKAAKLVGLMYQKNGMFF